MERSWQAWSRERGYLMVCGDPSILDDVRREIEARREAGELDQEFYRDNLAGFSYRADGAPIQARTLVMLAVPRPAHRLTFHLPTGVYEAIVPPTYVSSRQTSERIRRELAAGLGLPESRLGLVSAPLKPIAARLGLVTYGRNNITYAPGLGSYHQLVGIVTGLELGPVAVPRVPSAVPPDCRDCRACRNACPTGAIGDDRFLLRAERCLTLLNEREEPWPDSLSPSVHRCLVGCLACQEVCPRNAGLLTYESCEVVFDEAETACILAGNAENDPCWEGIRGKLSSLGLHGYNSVIGRNLRALVGVAHGGPSPRDGSP